MATAPIRTEEVELVTYRRVGSKLIYDVDPNFELDFPLDWTDYLTEVDDEIATVEYRTSMPLLVEPYYEGNDTHHSTVWCRMTPAGLAEAASLIRGKKLVQVTAQMRTTNTPPRVDEQSFYLMFIDK